MKNLQPQKAKIFPIWHFIEKSLPTFAAEDNFNTSRHPDQKNKL